MGENLFVDGSQSDMRGAHHAAGSEFAVRTLARRRRLALLRLRR